MAKRTLSHLFTPAVILVTLLSLTPPTLAADKLFPHPDRIRYDNHCLTIDGHDTLIFSSAFHYFRCPKELWPDRFQKLKAAGFNTLETYFPWNVHESDMPASLDDFSKVDLRDADDWMTMAESEGFYIIARPGPYICAEWDRGGFPGWLPAKRPADVPAGKWLRSDNPTFEAWSKHWLDAVTPLIAKHQITRKPPGAKGVILFQLENEYDYAPFSETVKANYVKFLAQSAAADGIDVPMFTCWTKCVRGNTDPVLSQVFDSCNFYPGWKIDSELNPQIAKLQKEQPNAPLMTTELQGGWFTGINDQPVLRPDADTYRKDLTGDQIQNITLLALQHGETITNYYMGFGGTNLADRAAENLSTSYDYSAPIRECGGVGEKFLKVAAIGAMLHDHGPALARSTPADIDAQTGAKDVFLAERKSPDGARYLFLRTSQHDQPRTGTATLQEKEGLSLSFNYDLPPLGSKILYLPPNTTDPAQGQWLPKPLPDLDRPAHLPAPISLTEVLLQNDPPAHSWHTLSPAQSLNDIGIYHSGFGYYQTTLSLDQATLDHAADFSLRIRHGRDDHTLLLLNGHPLPGSSSATRDSFPLTTAKPGPNDLLILYENVGNPNGGDGMEKAAGISQISVSPKTRGEPISGWKIHLLSPSEKPAPMTAADFPDDQWPSVSTADTEASQLPEQSKALFRTTVTVDEKQLASHQTELLFSRIDDEGILYVNGKKIGEAHDWSEPASFDAQSALHPGKNSLALVVTNRAGQGGLGPVAWNPTNLANVGSFTPLSYSDEPTRNASTLPDAAWTKSPLPESPTPSHSLLTWRRLQFSLPATPNVWVPWLVRLQTNGNGFLYLNGHPLGRIWQSGKQRDFYLPECWLNPSEKNTLTLSLRPLDKPIAIESAEIIPYTIYAEKR